MLPIFPLDLDLSPNGRFVVATGGGGNTNVVSVDVASRMIVNNLALRNNGQAQAVAVAPDGETVLAADFMGAQVHLLRLGPDGMLTQPLTVGSIPVDGRPNNIAISGRTAVVSITTTPDGMMNSLAVTILRIDGPLRVVRAGTVAGLPGFQQGAAFTPDGRRVLVLSLAPAPDQVSELRVDGPGMVSDTGRRVNLRSNMTGFFGMDAIGVVPDQSKAYVGNTGFNVLLSGVTVIDLTRMEITDIIRTPIPFGIVVPRPQ
jgi:DNA-binding beta-propeller fold protein YncE